MSKERSVNKDMNKSKDMEATNHRRMKVSAGVLAVIFSLFTVFGGSYDETQSWYLVFGTRTNTLFSAVLLAFLSTAFYLAIVWLFAKLDNILLSRRATPKRSGFGDHFPKFACVIDWYYASCKKHPFLVPLITLLAVGMPFCIMSYPGIFIGDSWWIVGQAVGGGVLNSHHPIAYTLLTRLFLSPHNLIGWNTSIYLLALFQTLCFCSAVAYALSVIIRKSDRKMILFVLICYYCFHPIIYAVSMFLTKDVLLTACYIAFIALTYRVFFDDARSTLANKIWLGIVSVGAVLFRNEGIYVVSCAFIATLFVKNMRLRSLCYLALIVAVAVTQKMLVFPLLHVEPGSVAEAMSVPFQQTARYVRDHPNDVTPAERVAINAVLDYDSLAVDYNYGGRADAVKDKYHGNSQMLKTYLITWAKMFLKHPGVYIQAVADSHYQYFYFGQNSRINREAKIELNEKSLISAANESGKTNFSYPHEIALARKGIAYQEIRDKLNQFPVLDILMQPAIYIWMLLAMVVYCIYRSAYRCFVLLSVGLMQIVFFVLGPTNGYFGRCELPMIVYLPVMITLCFFVLRSEAAKAK